MASLRCFKTGVTAVFIFAAFLSPHSLSPFRLSQPVKMDAKNEPVNAYGEKQVPLGTPTYDPETHDHVATGQNQLHRRLKGRHMQMIAMSVQPRVLEP